MDNELLFDIEVPANPTTLFDLVDLLKAPLSESDIEFLERNGCDDLTNGEKRAYTPADEMAISKINVNGKGCITCGDLVTFVVFRPEIGIEAAFEYILDRWDLRD